MSRATFVRGHVWAISASGTLRHTDPATTDWHDAPTLPTPVVALTRCEHRPAVLAACRDGSLHLLHAHSGDLLLSAPAPLHTTPLCLLVLHAENAVFAGLQDGAVVRLHLATLAFDCMLGCGVEHSAAVNVLDADDQYLYSAGEDSVVLVWDLAEATAVREISMPSAPVRSLLRVDVALWVGLENGAVEVFDIFGDDTNGIERISQKIAHAAPVTDLIRIGDTEVWSLATSPNHPELSLDHAPTIAVWDTRDMTYHPADDANDELARDIVSLVVVERVPLEDVTVLVLSKSSGPQYVSKQVRGSALGLVEDGSENFDTQSDFDGLPTENEEDFPTLRDDITQRMPSYQKSLVDDRLDLPFPDSHIVTPGATPVSAYLVENGIVDGEDCAEEKSSGVYSHSPTLAERSVDHMPIPRSVSETLVLTLRRLSEMLVTLLTDDILSPSEGHTRGSNDELRAAVASITRELNTGRQLVESHVSGNASENSIVTVDENDLSRQKRREKEQRGYVASAVIDKQAEIEKMRILQKDLDVVTKERDLLAQDLQQLKSQSETTLSSLESIIRDNDIVVASKDELVLELRKECKRLESNCQSETRRREDVELSLRSKLDKLSREFEAMKDSYEQKLKSAYDKLEIKSIDVQSQQDSIQAMEKQLESLRSSAKTADVKYEQLEANLSEALKKMQEAADDFASKSVEASCKHEDELSRLREKHAEVLSAAQTQAADDLNGMQDHDEAISRLNEDHAKRLDSFRKKLEDVEEKNAMLRTELEGQVAEKENVNANLRDEVERMAKALNDAKLGAGRTVEEQEAESITKCKDEIEVLQAEKTKLETELKKVLLEAKETHQTCQRECSSQLAERQARIDDLEGVIADLKARDIQICAEMTSYQEIRTTENVEKNSRVVELETVVAELREKAALSSKTTECLQKEILGLRDYKRDLQQELEHRIAAAKLCEAETATLGLAVSKYKTAAEQLQVALDNSEIESERHRAESERLLVSLKSAREAGTSMCQVAARGLEHNEFEDIGLQDSKMAMQALLASANGEIEQMTRQVELMHKVHIEQERELSELRSALLSPGRRLSTNVAIDGSSLKIDAAGSEAGSTGCGMVASADHNLNVLRNDHEEQHAADTGDLTAENDVLVSSALRAVQEGMSLTQDKLRELSMTARKFKRSAQYHIEVLPALYELENELIRVSREDSRRAGRLAAARGIVQSVIAQYFSTAEKRSVLVDCDEAIYAASSQRLEALQQTLAQMRSLRTGSGGYVEHRHGEEECKPVINEVPKSMVEEALNPRRVLTF